MFESQNNGRYFQSAHGNFWSVHFQYQKTAKEETEEFIPGSCTVMTLSYMTVATGTEPGPTTDTDSEVDYNSEVDSDSDIDSD
jgi:hypothetical protein